jgi:xylulokinase
LYLLGYDIGSSSIKATLIDAETGASVAQAISPQDELEMIVKNPGWAEQEPSTWWLHVVRATREIKNQVGSKLDDVKAIGIAYQMHGLVLVDKDLNVLRPSIIWCDSRAVQMGEKTEAEIGSEKCLKHLLNLPGNFTATKLRWVKENEPDIFSRIWKFMLPGDYIAMKLTGEVRTTPTGISEGILWNYTQDGIARMVLDALKISEDLIPEIVPVFSVHGTLTRPAADELGLPQGIPISYRAGDQPNNALSLSCLEDGEVAATAGTSGVVYAVSSSVSYDSLSRVNTFLHVNHEKHNPRYGTLMCVSGTGILYSWLKNNMVSGMGYKEMDSSAETVAPGSNGLFTMPYGTGAERTLTNMNPGSMLFNLNFNMHKKEHLFRSAQEGIIFALKYGLDIIGEMGIKIEKVKAGHANMFLSSLFRKIFANVCKKTVELYNTDGSQGAARGAGIGAGIYKTPEQAFKGLKKVSTTEPEKELIKHYEVIYKKWRSILMHHLEFERKKGD